VKTAAGSYLSINCSVAITVNLGTSSHGNGVIFHRSPPFFGDTSLTERSMGTGPPVIIQLSVRGIQRFERLEIQSEK
jgi:hypothetical protein